MYLVVLKCCGWEKIISLASAIDTTRGFVAGSRAIGENWEQA